MPQCHPRFYFLLELGMGSLGAWEGRKESRGARSLHFRLYKWCTYKAAVLDVWKKN